MRAVLVAILGWLLVGVVTAGPAAAHAELLGTTPVDGAQLDAVPAEVTLQFSESITLGAGYARVLDGAGQRVDTGTASVAGDTVTLPLRDGLPDAGYLVTYRVISADSHPVSGAFGFVVGGGEPVDQALADAADDGDPLVAGLLVLGRWLGYAGLALAVGVPAFVLLCWPAGRAEPRMRRTAAGGAAAVAAGAALAFLLQGPYAAGTGVGSLADPSLLGATGSTSYGKTLLVRAVLALVLLAVLRTGPGRAATVVFAALAAALVVGTAAVGHPVAGAVPAFAVAVTSVHVAAMTLWLGGLVALLAGLLRPGVPVGELATALPRFSRLAFGSVVAIVLTGVLQTLREVGTPTALFSTAYGWVLVTKVLLVLAVLAAAGVSRVWVQQHLGSGHPGRRVTAQAFATVGATAPATAPATAQATAPATAPAIAPATAPAAGTRAREQVAGEVEDVVPFRRSVLIEAAVVAVVLVLSAVLTGTTPARNGVGSPFDATMPLEGAAGSAGSVQVSMVPARPGLNTLHLYLFDETGQLTQPRDIAVSLTEEQQQIGPIDVDLEAAGPGHYISDAADVPTAGTWTLAVTVRVDEFTATTARTTFRAR